MGYRQNGNRHVFGGMRMQVEGLILAAGLSSRMGQNKMLLPIENMTMIEKTLHNMMPFCRRILVVTGHNHDTLETVLKPYAQVTVIHNKDYRSGMMSSIQLGFSALRGDLFFVQPGDIPFVAPGTFEALLNQAGQVVIPSYDMKAGHPILINTTVKNGIALTKKPHLRAYLSDFEKTYVCVDDSGILVDIDTQAAYATYVKEKGFEHSRSSGSARCKRQT